jgi:hypothetical protein
LSIRTALGLATVLLIAACTGPEIREPVEVTSAKPPLIFTVAEAVITDTSQLPETATFRDRQWSERLSDATEAFLLDRLQTGSGQGWLQVTIEQASLVEADLPTASGIGAALRREPDRVLEAQLAVRIAVMGPDGLEQVYADTEVSRRRPILRNTSVMARDAEAQRLIGDFLEQFDDALTQNARQNLGAWLVY